MGEIDRPRLHLTLRSSANERESRPEFPQSFGDSAGKGQFQIPFGDFPRQAEKFEAIGVLGYLLGQVGILSNKPLDKVRRRRACPFQRPVHDHVQQDVARPAVVNCGSRVTIPMLSSVCLVQKVR